MGEYAPLIILAVSVATTAASTGVAIHQAEVESDAANAQASMEKKAARARTDERLNAIRQLRGSQKVAAASAGVSLASPSLEVIQREDESRLKAAQSADDIRTAYEVAALKSRAKNVSLFGKTGAVVEGIGDVSYDYYRYKRNTDTAP